jgi:poly-gamma-glutamate synthesis protein (capsule biosynthesis protein)
MTDVDAARAATMFLCGDVMTGRGIDHVLAHPSDPRLFESYVKDAGEYAALAEAVAGPLTRPISDSYIWGDAMAELARRQPRVRVANLETSVTFSDAHWRGKGIHYRMHPGNIGCLTAPRFDICTLANNHVLDFGFAGLTETLGVLSRAGIRTAGAGADLTAARAPAIAPLLPGSRLLVFAFGTMSSGIPRDWAAQPGHAGVDLVTDLSEATAAAIAERIGQQKRRGDIAMASIHWGDNWGYEIPGLHQRFARRLIEGGVDLVHGHSSHHPRPIEIYRNRLILYGCGDFINDYEGISGYEQYRGDLSLMYFPTVSAVSGELLALHMVPLQIRSFRLVRASLADARWLCNVLVRTSATFQTRIELLTTGVLAIEPASGIERAAVDTNRS